MARLATCGFELGASGASMEGCAGGINLFGGGTTTVTAVSPITQTFSLKATPNIGGSAGATLQFQVAGGDGPYYARFSFRCDALPDVGTQGAIVYFGTSGTGELTVALTASGALALYVGDSTGTLVGTSSALISVGRIYRLELEFSRVGGAGAGVGGLYVDGVQIIRSTTLTLGLGVERIAFGSSVDGHQTDTSCITYFDNIAVNDSTGTKQTSFPGAGLVCYLRPSDDGDADTGTPTRGGTDSGAIWSQLDEVTPNDATDYVVLPVNPSDFWVGVQNGSVGGINAADTVTLVEVHARVSAASATACNWFPQIESQSAGTKVAAGAVTWASASWFTNDDSANAHNCKLVQYTDPQAGGVWTPGLIDTMQISAKTTDGAPDTWVSAIWAIVEYVPAIPPPIHQNPLIIKQAVNRAATW